MTKLEPDRIQRFEDHTFSITLIVLVVIAVLGGGFLYWYFLAQSVHAPVRAGMEDARGQDYSTIYAQLGIKQLPPNIERQPQIRNRLDQLSREPCYLNAIIGFADALLQAGYPRETDTSLLSFTRHCGGPDEILVRRYTALSQASDFSAAFPIVDQLVRSDPASAQVRYRRGLTYEKLNKFDRALTDYINSVQLLGDPVRVSVNMFYDISRMYVALGRYCDAMRWLRLSEQNFRVDKWSLCRG